MTLLYNAAGALLREGDSVKFRCDKQGRPLFKDVEGSGWNKGTITKIFGGKNPLFIAKIGLSGGQSVSLAFNSKNWPYGMSKLGAYDVVM